MAISDIGDDEIIAEINLTPLVDVALVLVIIFMIMAPFFSHVFKPVLLPASSEAQMTLQNSIKVSLFADGDLAVGAVFIEKERLAESIREKIDSGKPPWVVLRADKSIPHKRVMEIVRELRKAPVKRVAFATQPAATAAQGADHEGGG